MEKKSTKIAYFIALAVVIVALIIAKVSNDGSGFVATGWEHRRNHQRLEKSRSSTAVLRGTS